MPPGMAAFPCFAIVAVFRRTKLLAFLLGAFALLVSNAAAGLACGLAGSLAFAAAAVLLACAEIAGLDGLDVFHIMSLQSRISV